MIKSKTTNSGILEAVKELKEISLTKRLRYEYEIRLKAKRDREAEDEYLYEQGVEKGRVDEREKNIKFYKSKMRKLGFTDEQIVTDLMEEYGFGRDEALEKLQ